MRKDKLYILGTFVVLVWVSMTYFLFVHRPSSFVPQTGTSAKKEAFEGIKKRIQALEAGMGEQSARNKALLEEIQEIKAARDQLQQAEQTRQNREDQAFKDFPDYLPPGKDHEVNAGEAEAMDRMPVLMFACNRPTVSKSLDSLLKYRTDKDKFPIIVSQDCGHPETKNVILSYGDQVSLIEQPDLSDIAVPPKEKKFKGYFKIARHYGWALNHTFNILGFNQVIVVEDDLEFSPDFFAYFEATLPLLRTDKSLMCVSAWNDNGKASQIDEARPDLLYRTDFFGGLGWMLTKQLWSELSVKWPRSYWDDWIRDPAQRRDRSCIRPEVSRTKTFGKVGVSNGLFYDKHLKFIRLNERFFDFTKANMTYLRKSIYDVELAKMLNTMPVVTLDDLKAGQLRNNPVRLIYHNKLEFKKFAKVLGIMDDFKSGVPRMAYRGVVSTMFKGVRVYVAPGLNWKGYDPTWT